MKQDNDPFLQRPTFRVAQGGLRLWMLVGIAGGFGLLFVVMGVVLSGGDDWPLGAAIALVIMGAFCVYAAIALLRSGYEIRAGEVHHINALLLRSWKLADLDDVRVVEYRIDRCQAGGAGQTFATLDLRSVNQAERIARTGDRKKTALVEEVEQPSPTVCEPDCAQEIRPAEDGEVIQNDPSSRVEPDRPSVLVRRGNVRLF